MKSTLGSRGCVLFCLIAILMQFSCLEDSYRVKLSGPVDIGVKWLELQPETPLKAEKTLQWIALDLEPPFSDSLSTDPEKGKGILTPEGEVINPEVALVDQYGNEFNLSYGGSNGGVPNYGLPYPAKLPRDREYTMVKIKSDKTIKCKAVYWFCESSKDWK